MSLRSVVFFLLLALPHTTYGLVYRVRTASAQDLSARFKTVSCAVVRLQSDDGYGTGSFIDNHGDVLTAAHVVFSSSYSLYQGQIKVTLTPKPDLRLMAAGRSLAINILTTAVDVRLSTADLAIVKTQLPSPCFLSIGDSDTVEVGQHLIAVGYPSSSPNTVALYEGFLSSRYQHLPIPVGHIGSLAVYPNYQVLRVQMPVTPGTSGSPLVADDNTVVGVISEVPAMWTDDLSRLTSAVMHSPNSSSGIIFGGPLGAFDTTKILGELAWVVHEFESPGAGLAVPVSYLKLAREPESRP